MTLHKLAGLLAAFGLMLGLIGGGVGAVFQDQVTATENVNVGTFGCGIIDATPGASYGSYDALGYPHTVAYTAPTINSSAAGSAPFFFTVRNTGSINERLSITAGGPYGTLTTNFSAVPLAPASPIALAAGASQTFNTGIQWTVLSNGDLATSGSMVWTVTCGEVPPPVTITSGQQNFSSTGWAGWSCPAGSTIVSASVDTAPIKGGVVLPITSITNWEPGASIGTTNYPNTPFGYTYTPPEEGAIVQNGGTGQSLYIVLVCQP
jgi:hypothetical protein